jgi:hypothetical protein
MAREEDGMVSWLGINPICPETKTRSPACRYDEDDQSNIDARKNKQRLLVSKARYWLGPNNSILGHAKLGDSKVFVPRRQYIQVRSGSLLEGQHPHKRGQEGLRQKMSSKWR